jgi:hypothetical protein
MTFAWKTFARKALTRRYIYPEDILQPRYIPGRHLAVEISARKTFARWYICPEAI